jgi:hypothetical protein
MPHRVREARGRRRAGPTKSDTRSRGDTAPRLQRSADPAGLRVGQSPLQTPLGTRLHETSGVAGRAAGLQLRQSENVDYADAGAVIGAAELGGVAAGLERSREPIPRHSTVAKWSE